MMSNLDYYKSLISDDEVVKALLKESKARDGELEKTRVRPNMNFLQRTVTNIVSSNQRITSRQQKKIAEEVEKNKRFKPRKIVGRKKTAKELINEILTSQTKFVQSSVTEDVHFQNSSAIINKVNSDHTSELEVIQCVSGDYQNVQSSVSLDMSQNDLKTRKEFTLKSPILNNHPIQISDSDESPTHISNSESPTNYYKKKKCKKHELNKAKKIKLK